MSTSLAPLPAGWLHCDPSVGERVASSNFILIKAPLSASKYTITPNNAQAAFTPQTFLDSQQSIGRRVRYIIEISARSSTDLTPTRRPDESQYYDPAVEITPNGATFMHFQVQLTRPIPTSDPTQTPCPIDSSSIASFVTLLRGLVATCEREAAAEERKKAKAEKQAASASAAAATESDSAAAFTPSLPPFIYLHDLYGFNLAGFMLACYLVEEQGFDVMSAVNDIADSRPPGIYISSLFQALVNRYFAKEQIAEGVPEKDIQIPVIPDLPRPDFHEVPWTGIVTQKSAPVNAVDGTSSSSTVGASEKSADAGEEKFKRKARKKPNTAAPVAMNDGPSVSSTLAQTSSSSSSSSSSSLAGSKRPFEDVEVDSNKRSRPLPPAPTFNASSSSSSSLSSVSTSFTPSAVAPAPSIDSNYLPRVDVAKLRKDHPYLIPLQTSLIDKLAITLDTLMPASQLAGLGMSSVWDALNPTPLASSSQLSPLVSASYTVSWLPVCHQCLLLVLRECVYLIFGPKEWFLVPQVQFPKRKLPSEYVNSTLAVGELILDPLPNAPAQSRFLATDLFVMAHTNLLPILSHEKRMQALEVELIVPLKQHREKNGLLPSVQFNIRNKMQFALAKIDSAINMQVGHGNAGVEFIYKGNVDAGAQPVAYKYVWKKADASSSAVSQTILQQLAQK